jgi:hypothetical protein
MVLSRVLPSLECVLQKCISYHCRSTLAKYRYTFTPQASVHGQSESGFQSASRCFRCRNDQLTGSPEDALPAVAAVAARGRRQALHELAAREARARLLTPGEVRGGRRSGEADEGEEGDGEEAHGGLWRSTGWAASCGWCPHTAGFMHGAQDGGGGAGPASLDSDGGAPGAGHATVGALRLRCVV